MYNVVAIIGIYILGMHDLYNFEPWSCVHDAVLNQPIFTFFVEREKTFAIFLTFYFRNSASAVNITFEASVDFFDCRHPVL